MIERLIDWTERGYVADFAVRAGIRRLLRDRLNKVDRGSVTANQQQLELLITEFAAAPIAMVPEKANEQHYEVPAELFGLMLGPRRKYSCCWWPEGVNDLTAAEDAALAETCARAKIGDGMDVLELGCGWGSLTLWIAEHFSDVRLTAVSNSVSQREHILETARWRGIDENLTVITADMNEFATDDSYASRFDRVVSVEMFEHMRNHQQLMERIASWLRPGGNLFVHIFVHRYFTYLFNDEGQSDWMSRHFFSGGMMPSDGLLERYQQDLRLTNRWSWSGQHYQRTCEAWLALLDHNRDEALRVLEETYGAGEAKRWFNRWRMFHLACSELFGFAAGNEWFVGHYLFEKPH
jgi:cyclopropane-fatty-acyl-phospholipid synthase